MPKPYVNRVKWYERIHTGLICSRPILTSTYLISVVVNSVILSKQYKAITKDCNKSTVNINIQYPEFKITRCHITFCHCSEPQITNERQCNLHTEANEKKLNTDLQK